MSNNGPGGWFAVSRMIFDHYLVGIHNRPYTDTEAWLWLLSKAEFEQTSVMNKGQMIVLDPGQLMAAHTYLARVWMWTEDRVRYFLKKLQTEAMITRACTGKGRTNQIQVLTICNYSEYQHLNDDQHQSQLHQATHHAQPHAQHQATSVGISSENSKNEGSQHQATHQPPHQALHQESYTIDTKNKIEDDMLLQLAAEPPETLPIKRAFSAYNAMARRVNIPTARLLNAQRARLLRSMLKEVGIDVYLEILAKVENSKFLCGHGGGDRQWNADFDWIVNPKNYVKILDGRYDPKVLPRTNGFDAAYYERAERIALESMYADT